MVNSDILILSLLESQKMFFFRFDKTEKGEEKGDNDNFNVLQIEKKKGSLTLSI